MSKLEKVISKGAEANIFLARFYGLKCVKKVRISKKYRHEKLDEKLRKERTLKEAKIIKKLKEIGVKTARLIFVEKPYALYIEFLPYKSLNKIKLTEKICRKIAKNIAIMHNSNIIHGDLSLANMLYNEEDGNLYIIDFGLSFFSSRIEDKATDLLSLKKEFIAKGKETLWKKLQKYYSKYAKSGPKIIENIYDIEKRVRYASAKP